MSIMDEVQVYRARWDSEQRTGPFAGVRQDGLLAYTLKLSDDFIAWPGQQLSETVLVDLDVGVRVWAVGMLA